MTTTAQDRYSTGAVRAQVEQALCGAGLDLEALRPDDLAGLEDFHTLGRIATVALMAAAGVTAEDRVLDAGAGIGGTARYLAHEIGAHVTAADLSAEFCEVDAWLSELSGLGERIQVRQADLCALPFADAAFDVVITQHVQMNIADKPALYRELRRVLAPEGRLALWDVVEGDGEPPAYPLPWATEPGQSHLVTAPGLRRLLETSGFAVTVWEDATEEAAQLMELFLAQPPGALGLHVFVPDFAVKARNLVDGLADGRARLVRAVAVAT